MGLARKIGKSSAAGVAGLMLVAGAPTPLSVHEVATKGPVPLAEQDLTLDVSGLAGFALDLCMAGHPIEVGYQLGETECAFQLADGGRLRADIAWFTQGAAPTTAMDSARRVTSLLVSTTYPDVSGQTQSYELIDGKWDVDQTAQGRQVGTGIVKQIEQGMIDFGAVGTADPRGRFIGQPETDQSSLRASWGDYYGDTWDALQAVNDQLPYGSQVPAPVAASAFAGALNECIGQNGTPVCS